MRYWIRYLLHHKTFNVNQSMRTQICIFYKVIFLFLDDLWKFNNEEKYCTQQPTKWNIKYHKTTFIKCWSIDQNECLSLHSSQSFYFKSPKSSRLFRLFIFYFIFWIEINTHKKNCRKRNRIEKRNWKYKQE